MYNSIYLIDFVVERLKYPSQKSIGRGSQLTLPVSWHKPCWAGEEKPMHPSCYSAEAMLGLEGVTRSQFAFV